MSTDRHDAFEASLIRRVAVPAISFCQVPELVGLLQQNYPSSKINSECIPRYRTEEDTVEFLRGCDAAIVSFEPITESVLSALPEPGIYPFDDID